MRWPHLPSNRSFSLDQEAKVTPRDTLTQSFTATIPGDYVAAGVGLRGGSPPFFGPPPASGDIHLAGIPDGATITRAFLYWGMLGNSGDPALAQMNFNGTPINGSVIGVGPDTCWGRANSFTFRADVTPFVIGNGTYTLTNVASGGSILREGASLVVIYQLAGAPTKDGDSCRRKCIHTLGDSCRFGVVLGTCGRGAGLGKNHVHGWRWPTPAIRCHGR